jgi:hypothetical protein
MVELPDEAARAELLDALGDLVARHGAEPLLLPPLTPTPACFPDRWQQDAQGVSALARRLLAYAGLPEVEPEVALWSDMSPQLRARSHLTMRPGAIAALLLGLDGDVARFAVEESQLADPESVVAAMAHEVAHAWRARHGEVVEDERHEEELTDLTTVYLGFGVLTANAAYRYRKRGGYGYTEWSQQGLGYLGPGSLTFLLAAQALARGAGWRERRRILAELEPNQAGTFGASLRALRPHLDSIRRQLGGPSRRERPIAALPAVAPRVARLEVADFPDAPSAWNAGRPVFRVPRSRLRPLLNMTLLAAIVGSFVCLLAGSALAGPGGAQAGAVVGLVTAPLVGLWFGVRAARRVQDHCSDPVCGGDLPAGASQCPICGGTISGTIRRPEDRLAAEEALRLEGRSQAAGVGVPDPE